MSDTEEIEMPEIKKSLKDIMSEGKTLREMVDFVQLSTRTRTGYYDMIKENFRLRNMVRRRNKLLDKLGYEFKHKGYTEEDYEVDSDTDSEGEEENQKEKQKEKTETKPKRTYKKKTKKEDNKEAKETKTNPKRKKKKEVEDKKTKPKSKRGRKKKE